MTHVTELHRSDQSGAAFERVQHAQGLVARTQIFRPCGPLPQRASELRQQLQRFFLEHRKQIDAEHFSRPGCGRLQLERHLQPPQQRRVGFLQETRSKLMQQAPDIFCDIDEHLDLLRDPVGLALHLLQCVFQCPCHIRQGRESHRGRTAGQRMGQTNRARLHRPVQLQRPFFEFGEQAARPLVGFVEVHVVQRNIDAQRSNHPDMLIRLRGCHVDRLRLRLRLGHERRRCFDGASATGGFKRVRRRHLQFGRIGKARAYHRRTPVRVGVASDVLHPLTQLMQGVARQLEQFAAGRLLLGQPAVEQLLHRPGRLTKLGEAEHSGAALERVKDPA